jgi:hypothetical protein
MGNG